MRNYVFRKKRWKILFSVVDAVGEQFLNCHIPSSKLPKSFEKILIVRLDHLGDGILLTPLIRELRRNYPQAKLAALFSKEVAALYQPSSLLDKQWVLDKHWLSRGQKVLWSDAISRVFREIEKEHFDLGLDPRGDFRNIVFLAQAKIPYRIGYGSTGGGFLLSRELEECAGEHEIDRNLRLLRALGGSVSNRLPEVTAGKLPSDFPKEGKVVTLHSGAGTQAKRWPFDYWEALVRDLLKMDFKIALLGKGLEDENLAERFREETRIWNGVNRLSLEETWAVIQASHLFIGVDSGLAHGAGALGIPTLVLESGANETYRWSVQGSRVLRIRQPVFCSPCHLETCRFKTHDCMNSITVESVRSQIPELLNQST